MSRFCFLVLLLCPLALQAQGVRPSPRVDYEAYGSPLRSHGADPEIVRAISGVSPLRIKSNIEHLVSFGNRNTISSMDKDLPAGQGVLAAAEWIKAQFEAYSAACGGCLEVKVDEFTEPGDASQRSRIKQPTVLRNVYAMMRGSDPVAKKRMYLVTGHYDTRETDVMNTHDPAPGANDDSSGTAVSLECARVLSKLKLPATLVFVAVAGEEQGLNGSAHLAALAKREGWQLEGVFNNDIVGGDTTPGDSLQSKQRVRVFSQGLRANMPAEQLRLALMLGTENDTPSRELARAVLDVDRTYFPARGGAGSASRFDAVMELRLDRFLRGGDHKSFSDVDFPAVRFTEWRENYDHQHQHVRVENGKQFGDLLQFDDFNYIANVARLNAASMGSMSMSPGLPQNVRVVTTNLDNSTTLKWDAPLSVASGPVLYEVLWRETASNDWQCAHTAGLEREITLPISKDNVFFGVRACDHNGHCSATVTPVPGK